MSGCKGCGGGAAVGTTTEELAGKAVYGFNLSLMVTLHPCADCAAKGEKPHTVNFNAATGFNNVAGDVAERAEVILAALKAAAEAAKAAHEAH